MQYVFGILLMFTGGVSGLLIQDPVICRFTESDQCYVALGQRLHLEIPLNSEDGFNLKITDSTNSSSFIIKYRKSQSKPPTLSLPRWQFVNDNKTMILTSAERSDSGTYTLEIVGVNGTFKGTYSLQLNTEAKVTSVKVQYSCRMSGDIIVNCSADGENLRFNLTSDSNTFLQVENDTKSLTLNQTHHGNVTCHVENHVSRERYTIKLQGCPESTTSAMTSRISPAKPSGTNTTVSNNETNSITLNHTTSASSSINKSLFIYSVLIALGSVCAILIVISILAFCMYKKSQSQQNKNASSQDGKELVYAQVTHIPMDRTRPAPAQDEEVEYATVVSRSNKRKQKKKEDEVQYGELVFNTSPKNKLEKPKVQDDCVYSQVQHGH